MYTIGDGDGGLDVTLHFSDVDRIARVLAHYAGETRAQAMRCGDTPQIQAALIEAAERDEELSSVLAEATHIEFDYEDEANSKGSYSEG